MSATKFDPFMERQASEVASHFPQSVNVEEIETNDHRVIHLTLLLSITFYGLFPVGLFVLGYFLRERGM